MKDRISMIFVEYGRIDVKDGVRAYSGRLSGLDHAGAGYESRTQQPSCRPKCVLMPPDNRPQIPYGDDRELLMDILKYGADVEVLAPKNLRARVRESLKNTLSRYGI